MNKKEFVEFMDTKLKLVRTEYGLTQDKMALVLGISKKTLVEIEKNRKSLGWTGAVALASIFSHSIVLQDATGGDLNDIIIALAFRDMEVDYPRTWGGKVWWNTLSEEGGYKIQQNMFSRHFRMLDPHNRRIYVSFSLMEAQRALRDLLEEAEH